VDKTFSRAPKQLMLWFIGTVGPDDQAVDIMLLHQTMNFDDWTTRNNKRLIANLCVESSLTQGLEAFIGLTFEALLQFWKRRITGIYTGKVGQVMHHMHHQ